MSLDTNRLVAWLTGKADRGDVVGAVYQGIADRIRRGDFDERVDCRCGGDLELGEHCHGCGRTGTPTAASTCSHPILAGDPTEPYCTVCGQRPVRLLRPSGGA